MHLHLAPGIEPGNLIRSTLIRYPPGPFFEELCGNMVTGVTQQNTVENLVVYKQCNIGKQSTNYSNAVTSVTQNTAENITMYH